MSSLFVTPGSSTTTRSEPWVWTTGSETPVEFTRRSMMSRIVGQVARARELAVLGQGLVLDAEAALEVEAQLRLDHRGAPLASVWNGSLRPGQKSRTSAARPMMTIR